VRGLFAFSLVFMYFVYLMLTIRASAKLVSTGTAPRPTTLYLARIGLPRISRRLFSSWASVSR